MLVGGGSPCASHTFLALPRATIGITTDGTGVGSESWREPQRTLRVPSPPGDAVTERRRSEDLRSAGVVLFWNCLGRRRRTRIWRRALFPRSTVFSGEQKRWVLGTTCISGLGCVCGGWLVPSPPHYLAQHCTLHVHAIPRHHPLPPLGLGHSLESSVHLYVQCRSCYVGWASICPSQDPPGPDTSGFIWGGSSPQSCPFSLSCPPL